MPSRYRGPAGIKGEVSLHEGPPGWRLIRHHRSSDLRSQPTPDLQEHRASASARILPLVTSEMIPAPTGKDLRLTAGLPTLAQGIARVSEGRSGDG